jgi:recombinational DNA repair protein (RecF pathway)
MALRQAFELKILQATGFGLEFGHCRLCGEVTEPEGSAVYFVPSRGGIVCARCRGQAIESAVRIEASNAVAVARLSVTPLAESTADPHCAGDGVLAIARFLATILDRKLRSVDFLNSTL